MVAGEQPRPRAYFPPLRIAAAAILLALALGLAVYFQAPPRPDNLESSAFNLQSVDLSRSAHLQAPASEPPTAAPSGLSMVRISSAAPISFRPAGAAGIMSSQKFNSAFEKNETGLRVLGRQYTAKYRVIREWREDWRNSPDLNGFRAEFDRDRDPIKFVDNVLSSPNFAKLVQRYAGRPELLSFVQNAVKSSSSDLLAAVGDYLNKDGTAAALVGKFSAALGLPPGLVSGLSKNQKLDTNQAANEIIKSNPQLQGLINSGDGPAKTWPGSGN